jgi:hypothetical protein
MRYKPHDYIPGTATTYIVRIGYLEPLATEYGTYGGGIFKMWVPTQVRSTILPRCLSTKYGMTSAYVDSTL